MNKILFIAPSNSIHTFKWINFFKDKFQISLLSPYSSNFNYRYIDYKNFKKYNLIEFYLMYRSRFKKKFSTVHIQSISLNIIYFIILFLFFKTKIIITPWGSDIHMSKSKIKNFFIMFCLKKSTLITTDSFNMKEFMNSKYSIHKNKIKIINFGIDTNIFKLHKFEFANIQKEINIISIRNFEPTYNIETLINALEIVSEKKQQINIKVYLIGIGSLFDFYEKNINQKQNLEYFFCKNINQSELINIAKKCHLSISTSLSDAGIAASTAEMMSLGMPCIATEVSDNSKWIENHVSGFLFEPKNSDSLSKIILEITDNKHDLKMIGVNASNKIYKKNNIIFEMSKMEEIYNKL